MSDHPNRVLLFFVESDLKDRDKTRRVLQKAIERLGSSRSWIIHPPIFVNEIDLESCTYPEDEPIETIGGYLEINSSLPQSGIPAEIDREHLFEVEAIIGMLNELSIREGMDFGLELDGELIGNISAGRPNRSLEIGLLDEWRRRLGLERFH